MNEDKSVEKKVNLEGFAASVELPEGHQLVIGELPPGTVVEVATWQGTGRPDETTNRFLLSASGSGLQRRQRSEQENSTGAPEKSPMQITPPAVTHQAQPSVGSVGAAGSYLGMKTFGVESEPETVAQGNTRWRIISRSIFSTVAVIAISAMVLSILGISAVVPYRGTKTSLGPSTLALVVYKKSPAVSLGNPTVAMISVSGQTKYIFGPSNSFDEKTIQIETTAGQELVANNAIVGRAFLAIPGIGFLLKPFVN
jgi:hypothetical protein